ncbi:MAG: hypothetical protein KGZ40_00580 [Clostridiales bacterium]|nr:hypothetical protein [Clostridiales bacterium]
MMRWPLACVLAFVAALATLGSVQSALATTMFDAPLSPAEVVEIDRALDGHEIVVEGEAIGEHLRAMGGGRWVNILGDEVGLGIWVTDEMAARIEHFGDYRHTGDIVRVTGIVNIACEEHGGEFDVHATSLEIISRGEPRPQDIEPMKGVIGGVGLVFAYGLWWLYRMRRDRRMI